MENSLFAKKQEDLLPILSNYSVITMKKNEGNKRKLLKNEGFSTFWQNYTAGNCLAKYLWKWLALFKKKGWLFLNNLLA